MSGVHKYPTISFRISPRQREELETRILISGLRKKDYFIRPCLNNCICVVGKKEHIYILVEELKKMDENLKNMEEQIKFGNNSRTIEEIDILKNHYLDLLKSIIWMIDSARYLWEGNGK